MATAKQVKKEERFPTLKAPERMVIKVNPAPDNEGIYKKGCSYMI